MLAGLVGVYGVGGTYEVGAGQNLTSGQYLLLGRLVSVLLVGEVQAGGASGKFLALLQRGGVTLVHAVQGAPPHAPVEVVHALPLQGHQGTTVRRNAEAGIHGIRSGFTGLADPTKHIVRLMC